MKKGDIITHKDGELGTVAVTNGDIIIHKSGQHQGVVVTDPYKTEEGRDVIKIQWGDYKEESRHTIDFIERNYYVISKS